jgi:hypothetical protein
MAPPTPYLRAGLDKRSADMASYAADVQGTRRCMPATYSPGRSTWMSHIPELTDHYCNVSVTTPVSSVLEGRCAEWAVLGYTSPSFVLPTLNGERRLNTRLLVSVPFQKAKMGSKTARDENCRGGFEGRLVESASPQTSYKTSLSSHFTHSFLPSPSHFTLPPESYNKLLAQQHPLVRYTPSWLSSSLR